MKYLTSKAPAATTTTTRDCDIAAGAEARNVLRHVETRQTGSTLLEKAVGSVGQPMDCFTPRSDDTCVLRG